MKTRIIAHRGFWNSGIPAAQNSLRALRNAQKLPVYGIETDVRLSADGMLVIHHDEKLGNLEIADSGFKALQAAAMVLNKPLATLEDFILEIKKTPEIRLITELKPCKSLRLENDLAEKTLHLFTSLEALPQAEFISFSLSICKALKNINPATEVHYLGGDLKPEEILQRGLDGMDYHYAVFLRHPDWISRAKNLGLRTNAWTVNSRRISGQLRRYGIEAITTDCPQRFVPR